MSHHYIYGLDPASRADYFGLVLHDFPEPKEEEEKPLPRLKAINMLRGLSFERILSYLTEDIFQRYRPYKIVIDTTNEKTLSDLLVAKYGSKVELVNFTLASKHQLKQDGLSILRQGYRFPPPSALKDPQIREWVAELISQLKREQIIETKTGKVSYDHPSGQHNDLAIAWELSIHGCLQFMLKRDRHLVSVHRRVEHDTDDPYAHLGSGIPTRAESLGSAIYVPGY